MHVPAMCIPIHMHVHVDVHTYMCIVQACHIMQFYVHVYVILL